MLRRLFLSALGSIALASSPAPLDAQVHTGPGIIGLVEVPRVLPVYLERPDDAPVAPGPVTVRSEPSESSAVLGVVERPEEIESREHGYEESSAVVYGYERAENRSWFRVRLASGALGWLSDEYTRRFRTVGELLVNSLAYMTEAWDRTLYGAPGRPGTASTVDPASTDGSVSVAQSARVDDDIYVLVVVLDQGICVSGDPGEVVAAGWVPVHAASGAMNLWFYSRGC